MAPGLELYRGDLSSMALSLSEALYWDNDSSVGSHHYPYGKLASIIRDRKPSEVESYGLDHPPPIPCHLLGSLPTLAGPR